MKDASEIRSFLSKCHGSENIYRHFLPNICYTEGVKGLAEIADCYWLIDAIASYQWQPLTKTEAMWDKQIWNLTVSNNSAVLTCQAYNSDEECIRQEIEYTDFPLPEITLYCRASAMSPTSKPFMLIMIPSED